jgi:hypothetical protein
VQHLEVPPHTRPSSRPLRWVVTDSSGDGVLGVNGVERQPLQANKRFSGNRKRLGLLNLPLYSDWFFWFLAAVLVLSFSLAPAFDHSKTNKDPYIVNVLLFTIVWSTFLLPIPLVVRVSSRIIQRRRRRRPPQQFESAGQPYGGALGSHAGAGPRTPLPTELQRSGLSRSPWNPQRTGQGHRIPWSPPRDNQPVIGSWRAPGGGSVNHLHPSSPVHAGHKVNLRKPSKSGPGFEFEPDVITSSDRAPGYPYTIARIMRLVSSSSDPRERYELVLRAAEALSITLAIWGVTAARYQSSSTPQTSALMQSIGRRGASMGLWVDAAASLGKPQILDGAHCGEFISAFKAGKGGSGLERDLRAFVEERNRWAHGAGPQTPNEFRDQLNAFEGLLRQSVSRCHFLCDRDWVCVTRSTFSPRDEHFWVTTRRLMGDHPDFEESSFHSRKPLGDSVCYLRWPTASLELSPLLVLKKCDTCRREELYYVDRIDDRRGPVLKSFDRGHLLFEPEMVRDLASLTEQFA